MHKLAFYSLHGDDLSNGELFRIQPAPANQWERGDSTVEMMRGQGRGSCGISSTADVKCCITMLLEGLRSNICPLQEAGRYKERNRRKMYHFLTPSACLARWSTVFQ